MPLVIGGPYQGGFFGGANVEVSASGSLSNAPQANADIIVQADGGGDYPTIQEGIDAAANGEIVEVRNNTPGSSQTWDEEMLFSASNSGINGSEKTLRFRAGDTFNFYPTTSNVYIMRMTGASYWIIEGDTATVNIGDKSEWSFQNSASSPYTHDRGIFATNSHHFDISGLDFSGADLYEANEIENDCYLFRFKNCTFDKHGSNDAGTSDDWGNLFALKSYDSIIEDCSFSHGGHETCLTSGNGNVLRRNTFDGNWEDVSSTSPGQRPVVISNASGDFSAGQGSPFGPVLFEDNIVKECDESEFQTSGGQDNQTVKLDATRIIFRYNYMWDNNGQGLSSGAFNSTLGQKHTAEVKIYNNTQFNSAAFYGVKDRSLTTATNLFEYASIKNNLGTSITGAGNPSPHFIWWDASSVPVSGHSDDWLSAVWNNNQIDPVGTLVELRGTSRDWVTTAESTWSNFTNNLDTTPVFVNSAARTKAGFALSSGAGIDHSESLTSITATASDTETITVDDAYHFYDGFNLSYFGEAGDYIAVYSDESRGTLRGIRQIDSIISKTSIALTATISVTSGDVVYPVLPDGTTVVVNRGAAQ